jgi:hypothetical protein
MPSPRTRLIAALLAAVVLLAPVAGCGGDSGTSSKKPSGTSSGVSSDAAAFVTRLVDAISKQQTARLDLELGSSLSATADVDYADSGTSMSMKMVTGAQTVNVVLDGGVMYLQQTKGSKYLKIGKDDPALGSLLGQLGGFGPKSALENLKAGITKVQDKGSETVDGAELEHYALTVDTKKANAIFGVPSGSAKTPAKVTYNLWIDGDDLLRQVKMKVSGQTLVMKVSDWGKPVTIKAPPASQVIIR